MDLNHWSEALDMIYKDLEKLGCLMYKHGLFPDWTVKTDNAKVLCVDDALKHRGSVEYEDFEKDSITKQTCGYSDEMKKNVIILRRMKITSILNDIVKQYENFHRKLSYFSQEQKKKMHSLASLIKCVKDDYDVLECSFVDE